MSQALWAKNSYRGQTLTTRPRMFTTLAWKAIKTKLPSYSSLISQEMPLSFKHIFAVIPCIMPLVWRCPYTWHVPNIHVSESNIYLRAIPAVMQFCIKFYYSLTLKITAPVWTSQTCPKVDGVKKSVAYSTYNTSR